MIRAAGVLLCACVAVSSAQTQGDSHYAMGGNCLTLVIWTEFRGKPKK